ncbi:MAG: hypothetical protein ACOX6S_12915 [Clostridia bacterium]|jgi:hypothetical protein
MSQGNTGNRWMSLEKVLETASNQVNRNIAIQFECGHCCKKVLYGQYIDVLGSYVVLRPMRNEDLIIKVFSAGELVERQRADVIIIPVDRICSIEFGAVEIDD